MNFRQIHLDFHTSECIDNIGSEFSKENFQEALKRGHINSITLFSKCHHGWAYHPSEKNEQHPNLHFDLLGAEIEAAHEIGVKTPIYISAGLDEKMARRHPEWLLRNKDESTTWAPDFAHDGYHEFCMNSPYLDYLLEQIKETLTKYDADGLFLDIVGVHTCYCQNCVRTLLNEGKDPYDEKNATELAERVYANYTKRVRETVDSIKPGLPVFHNGGHIRRGRRDLADMDTHLELESLPTGGWGYDHFPLSASYVRTLGKEYMGMTGKFHTTWGEFGGFKHPNALRYEAALDCALGAKCSVGDQLHPSGKFDLATYDLIGKAYSEVEAKEPWLDNVTPVADIAILSQEAVANHQGTELNRFGCNGDYGAVRIMLEGKYLFNTIDLEEDFNKYKLIILPDSIRIDELLKNKLNNFLNNGGKILASGQSGLLTDKDNFAFDFGAEFIGKSNYQPVYFRPRFTPDDLLSTAFVIYSDSYDIKATGDILADRENPYFNRSLAHFCSHQHAPNNPAELFPAITKGKDGIYISSEIFNEYREKGSYISKNIVLKAIDELLGNTKTITTDLPAQGIITLMEQKDENRYIEHLLYATPVKRGDGIEIIEDIIPLYNIHTSIRLKNIPSKVYMVDTKGKTSDLPYTYENGVLNVTIPKLDLHAMVVINK